jgi:hypothetical protein
MLEEERERNSMYDLYQQDVFPEGQLVSSRNLMHMVTRTKCVANRQPPSLSRLRMRQDLTPLPRMAP